MFLNLISFKKTHQFLQYQGEVVFGPAKPIRTKTANCFGVYYGERKGLDAANIFAKVIDTDLQKLKDLGDNLWKNGSQKLTLLPLDKG